jgi:hypothetical protein
MAWLVFQLEVWRSAARLCWVERSAKLRDDEQVYLASDTSADGQEDSEWDEDWRSV